MINNDVLRSVRYMLKISEFQLVEIVKLGGGEVTQAEMNAFIKKEDEPGFVECTQRVMAQFLNGLIYFKRGKDESRPPLQLDLPTNNVVLKKLRVAFELKEDDILNLLANIEYPITKPELSAFFRKEGHTNYRVCGDQFLRNFLKGLTNRLREST
ncbi:MAG TPA: DUF1456 family protein [Bacteriovoracaceae bacterium]|nr:DUF1456 family protein [Bacteriovoracaceae bacterium]